MRQVVLAAVLMASVSACSGSVASETTEPPSTTLTAPPSAPDVDVNSIPNWFQDENAAPASLVAVIGGELDANYVGSMAIVWPTGGLGCSSGGTDLQVLTTGYVIYFESEDSLHRIHAADNGRWIECELSRVLEGTPVLNS